MLFSVVFVNRVGCCGISVICVCSWVGLIWCIFMLLIWMWLVVGLWKCSSIDSMVFLFVLEGLIRVMVLFGCMCRLK